MLLSRLLGWFRTHNTTQVFLLEILAIFIGITASLFIDDWRHRKADYETLDHFLEEIHHNAIVQSSQLHIELLLNNLALQSAIDLLYGDPTELNDEQILEKVWVAGLETGTRRSNIGYERLSNTPLSIPFNETMAQLDEAQSLALYWGGLLEDRLARVREEIDHLVKAAGLVYNYDAYRSGGLTPTALSELSEFLDTLERDGKLVYRRDNLAAARSALADEGFRAHLRHLLQNRIRASEAYIGVIGYNEQMVATIRTRLPGVTLPARSIGIAGPATGRGWDVSVPLARDRSQPHLWRGTVELVDGELKFRADDSWSTNWGGPRERMQLLTDAGWSYRGELEEVFPAGVADFNGSNIPATAGRYNVTFNAQTFEYAFVPVLK